MLQLRCTQKAQRFLGLKREHLSEVKSPSSLLGNWYVNIFVVDRRKTILFMNERTLLSFVIFGARKEHVKAFSDIFLRGVDQLLSIEGIDDEAIDRVLSDYETLEYTATSDRKVLGNMNDLMDLYKHFIFHGGGYKNCDLWSIISRINRTPQRNLGWMFSIDVAGELLETAHGSAT